VASVKQKVKTLSKAEVVPEGVNRVVFQVTMEVFAKDGVMMNVGMERLSGTVGSRAVRLERVVSCSSFSRIVWFYTRVYRKLSRLN